MTVGRRAHRPTAHDELVGRYFASLPADQFPDLTVVSEAMASGSEDDPFECGLYLLVRGLVAHRPPTLDPPNEMTAEIHPPELARLVEFAERPRSGTWSFRAALVRYAQPEPERVAALLDVVRRTEWALQQHTKRFEREGEDLWRALESGDSGDAVVELLRVSSTLDRLGDLAVAWAIEPAGDRPNEAVDATAAEVARRLDALGVPQQERPPGPRNRG